LPLAVGPAISATGYWEGALVYIATLIAKERLARGDISAARDALGGSPGFDWVEEGRACDLLLPGPAGARAALEGLILDVDVVVQPAAGRRKRLLVADMDSTMIGQECIDELADYAGLRDEVAAVTEQAMRGELDFEAALDARVALLAGLDEAAVERCHAERVRLTPGARALVGTMRANRAYCLLVSGGFSLFADRVAAEIGFDAALSNLLRIEGGRLAGTVSRPILGAAGKKRALVEAAEARGIPLADTLAVGDGANDIPMIEAAGLGIAYHAKPAAAAAADARIEANDLTALLYAQGYAEKEWVEDS
jgi:phosphoserine phosphatase